MTARVAAGSLDTLLSAPAALAMNRGASDSPYVVDEVCHMVRRIDLSTSPPQSYRVIGDGTTGIPGNSTAGGVHLSAPRCAAVDSFGNLHVTSRNAVVPQVVSTQSGEAHSKRLSLGEPGILSPESLGRLH